MTTNMTKMKRWKTYMIESNGDYRDEIYLEKYIGGPLYEYQSTLPRLIVPTLDETIKRFLPTALPLVKTNEEKMKLIEDCKLFPQQAKILQQRLLERRNGDMKDSSYLQMWWNQLGYLQVRDPVVVNVSYFFSFIDDPTIDVNIGSKANIQRGAAMLYATAEFRKLVCTGQLQPERIGKKKKVICSTAYKYMFNSCRIPHRIQDTYRMYDPSRYTHCIIARKGHFFTIEFVEPDTGNPLPLSIIEEQLEQCIILADNISSTRPKFGIMTSNNRDDWADARDELLRVGGIAMDEALTKLESGAILLNLDDETPISRQELGELYWCAGLKSGENRWFDKSIEIMIPNNGKAGLIAEHSMMDGMPMINYANYITKTTYGSIKQRSSPSTTTNMSRSGKVVDIFADVLNQIDQSIVEKLEMKAWKAFHKLITDHSLHAQSFQGYGSSFIKKNKFPPDAYVQIAMNLATYRLFGEQVGTYEATQTRPFLHGRTEVTRTVSTASEAFIKVMGLRPKMDEHDPICRKEKIQLLRNATKVHAKYTGLAANSNGVDRHFLGLSLLLSKENNETLPNLFSNPVFIRSKTWRASTSQLTHPRFNLWGYGEVVPNGVGLSYAILPRCCVFNITALRKNGYTDKLSELLEEALLEMRFLVEMDKNVESSGQQQEQGIIRRSKL